MGKIRIMVNKLMIILYTDLIKMIMKNKKNQMEKMTKKSLKKFNRIVKTNMKKNMMKTNRNSYKLITKLYSYSHF
jgi:hypothetical protein